jgi:hypothetical protein
VTLKNLGIGMASLALALSPALAQASPTGHGKPEGAPGKGNGSTHRSESGSQHAGGADKHGDKGKGKDHAKPRKCSEHEVAYIVSGALVSDTLSKSESGDTYSGQVVVEVTHTNRHARSARGETETYTVQDARVRGPIAVEALKQGDEVKLIGKIASMAPKCESPTITPAITITKLVFHAPHSTTHS